MYHQNKNFFGNPFYEFKLLLIPEITLHTKVSFGKKNLLTSPMSSGECLYHCNKFSKCQQVSQPFSCIKATAIIKTMRYLIALPLAYKTSPNGTVQIVQEGKAGSNVTSRAQFCTIASRRRALFQNEVAIHGSYPTKKYTLFSCKK